MNTKTFIKSLFLGFILTGASILMATKGQWMGWIGTLFFGSILIGSVIKFIYPSFKYIKFDHLDSSQNKPLSEEQFMEMYEDDGIFEYNETGFTIVDSDAPMSLSWTDIQSLVAYKEDHFTTDSICLEIVNIEGAAIKITEETRGWHQFLVKTKKQFPQIDEAWEIEIANPAFEPKVTLIYDRDNRSLEEVLEKE